MHAARPIGCAHHCTWQKFKKDLAELHASSELYPTKLAYVYLAKVRKKLIEINASSEIYPRTLCPSILSKEFKGELNELFMSFKLYPTRFT